MGRGSPCDFMTHIKAATLDKLVAGDKVVFTAEQQQGAYVVTAVEKAATQ